MATATAKSDQLFVPISLATLLPASLPQFPLYIREADDQPPRLYRDAGYPVDKQDLARLVERGVKHLYVIQTDQERYQNYLRETFSALLIDESLPLAQRFSCLNEVVRDVLSEVFANRNPGSMVEAAGQLAVQTVDLICRDDIVATELLQVLHHDYYTFTHSANVSFCCVLLAKEMGVSDPDELQQIGAGALLHDIGKLDIPERILKKRGRLDEEEWRIIRQHPTTGMEQLGQRTDLTYGQLMMVYQHHERLDGSGYPVGVSADNIHPWAQMCSIADVYEALSSNRPYRPALPKKEVFQIMDRQSGSRLNRGMWECWKKIIQKN